MSQSIRGGRPLSVSILGGPLSFQDEAGLPLQIDLIRGLEDLGFVNETVANVEAAYPDLPKFPADRLLTNAFGLDDLVIGFGIYMGVKLSDKIIDELVGDVYEATVRPRLSAFWKRMTNRRRSKRLVATFDHWFDVTGVLVRVEFYLDPASDAEPDLGLVADALQLARVYLLLHGLTHRVLAYEVSDGVLSQVPRLAEPLL